MTDKIAVCVTVLNRYDLLRVFLVALESSHTRPLVYIIDNGSDEESLSKAMNGVNLNIIAKSPVPSYGLAQSWNWFIDTTREDGFDQRIISNDDVKFAPGSIDLMTKAEGDLIFSEGIGFSCFLIKDSCVNKIGTFDESLSPGFAYFEDCDYMFRIDEYNRKSSNPLVMCDVPDTGIDHYKCGTQKVSRTPEELVNFRRKYYIAQENFIVKWGRLPSGLRRMDAAEWAL